MGLGGVISTLVLTGKRTGEGQTGPNTSISYRSSSPASAISLRRCCKHVRDVVGLRGVAHSYSDGREHIATSACEV